MAASFVNQSALTRQDDNLNLSGGKLAAQWVRFAVVVAAAALHTKAMLLWSESRILRKMRARHPRKLRDSLMSEHPDHAFVELYVSHSKGRHRTYSRYYALLYYFFTFAIDAIDVVEFFAPDSFVPDVFASEELTAFRLLIYVGSFATFGAVNLTTVQSSLLVFCNITLATLHIVFGYGVFRMSKSVRIGLLGIQVTLIVIFFCVRLTTRSTELASLAEIVSRMASIRENNFHDPSLERIDLRKSLSEKQYKRLEKMEELALMSKNVDVKKARAVVRRWDTYFVDFFIFFLVSGISAMVWGNLSRDQVPRIVFVDCLEATSTFLLCINNTVVENMLFVKLLQIATIPKSGTYCTSCSNGNRIPGTI